MMIETEIQLLILSLAEDFEEKSLRASYNLTLKMHSSFSLFPLEGHRCRASLRNFEGTSMRNSDLKEILAGRGMAERQRMVAKLR